MTIDQMHIGFRFEIDESTNLENPSFEPEEIDLWLNKAIKKFVKTRYSGINIKGESFEQTQKRIDDLRTLVAQETLPCVAGGTKENCYIADLTDLTDDYWFTLGEEVLIGYYSLLDVTTTVASGSLVVGEIYLVITDDVVHNAVTYSPGEYILASATTFTGDGSVIKQSKSKQGVTEITIDTYRSHIDNPYSTHVLHYEEAMPLRLFIGDLVEFISDGQYGVVSYDIRYLRAPVEVDWLADTQVDCDLAEHTHDEIVKLAASMALENIEQPRYQSHMNEINTME
jgi:hypothetical protein